MPGPGSNDLRPAESSEIDADMKLKRYIALLLCAFYVSATAGTALASLTCKCLGMKASVEHRCTGCCHLAETDAAGLHGCQECSLKACCDCELHSTEIDLYTSSYSDDSEKYIRCVVAVLPLSLAAEIAQDTPACSSSGNGLLRNIPLPREVCRAVAGLRAPPVAA